jgi:hypothetical protein
MPWDFWGKLPGMLMEKQPSDLLCVDGMDGSWDERQRRGRCNALVRECRGFHVWVDSKNWWPLPFPSEAGPFGTSLCFRRFLPALTDTIHARSLWVVREGRSRVPPSRAKQGGGEGGQGWNGRDGQRGARRFVVKYRVGRSGVDRCVRGVCDHGPWAAMGHAAGY